MKSSKKTPDPTSQYRKSMRENYDDPHLLPELIPIEPPASRGKKRIKPKRDMLQAIKTPFTLEDPKYSKFFNLPDSTDLSKSTHTESKRQLRQNNNTKA